MENNEGKIDRIIRLIAGLGIVFFAYTSVIGMLQIVLYVIAGVLLFTAISGFCLLYKIFGISTCSKKGN